MASETKKENFPKRSRSHPSGDGERSAQIGYYPQYCIAADKVYEGLLNGSFESISLADPTVGAVDDILIVSTNRVDAYQVKWSENPGFLSFKSFIYGSTGSDSLLGKLAHGWKTVSNKYNNTNVFVHLLTCNLAHHNKNAKVALDTDNYDGTFYDFVSSWNNKTFLSDEKAKVLFKKLAEYVNLGNKIFEDFYNFSYFQFGFSNPFDKQFSQSSKNNDYNALYKLIMECVGGQTRLISLSKDELINKLGWNNRFELQFSHEFPKPMKYEPIQTSIKELEAILEKITSGYVAFTGTPGSGKSTTLSQYFMKNNFFRHVSYYAYIPNNYYGTRGESFSFFSDTTKQLEVYGFKGNTGVIPQSLEEFKRKLGKQLLEAHEKYNKDKRKTIILIDGLDHIVREQSPHASLLKDLPAPDNIPEGVLFILGTQTIQLNDMLPAIRNQLNKNGRTITINQLTKKNKHMTY